ncbi:hypothetical protein [Vallitalea guaymasensis]|uniref:Uncharacterized protein n=1 Tax=Vallitalea guaymasensis TaxID=1185412 RepID=A0A8J8M9F3_9FIRM|nr:hypothetical protein [Vallitalea guaymasensis]QUH28816.1 hypothetical protein HYG85_07770 [Vallitalea guaymasensis]
MVPSVFTHPEQLGFFITFVVSLPFSSKNRELMKLMIKQTYDEWKAEYDNADAGDKGFMIGQLIGEAITFAVEAGGFVKGIKGLTQFVKNGGFRKAVKQVVKMGSSVKKLLKMKPAEFIKSVKKIFKRKDHYEVLLNNDELVKVPYDDLTVMQKSKFDGFVDSHMQNDVVPDRVYGEDGIGIVSGEGTINGKLNKKTLSNYDSYMNDDLISTLDDIGLSIDEFNELRMVSADKLTSSQRRTIKSIRDAISTPTNDTIMQKVIPQRDINAYLNGDYTQVGGYITKAQDVKQLNNYDDIFQSLRLDYEGTQFKPVSDDSIGIIRFKTPEASKIEIPYGKSMDGVITDEFPFTGNGFTAATNGQVIPEYKCQKYLDIYDGAELYSMAKDGTESLLGIYDSNLGRFIKIGK